MNSDNEQFLVSDKVKISDFYFWAKGAVGTIRQPPDFVSQLIENSSEAWNGHSRQVQAVSGLLTFYWVEFDEPQFDLEEDSPYLEAEIQSDYLSRLS